MSPRLAGPGHDSRFGRMVGFSALIHILVLGIIIFSTHLPAPKLTFGPVYSVQLVAMPDRLLNGPAASSSPLSQEILRPQSAPSPIILKKPVEMTPAAPMKKAEVLKKQSSPGVEKALEEIRNRVRTAAPSPPSHLSSAGEAPQAAGQADAGQRLDAYYAAIWAKIRGQWSMPQGILSQGNIETVINARILRNGAVVDVSFEKRSNNRYFDESAMRALRKASPLPPLPPWVRGSSIELGIRFRSAELR